MNQDRVELAKRINEEQIRICSRPSFRGYVDRVLFKLLDKYSMTLTEYYDCYHVLQNEAVRVVKT